MGAAVAVVLIKERHIVEAFERAGATSADRAVVPEDIDVAQYGVGWRRLCSRSVIREAAAGNGRFYAGLAAWRSVRANRRRVLVAVLVVVTVLGALGTFGTGMALPWLQH